MNTELIGSIAQIVLMVVLAYPLGKYIAKVYRGEKTCLDFLAPMERWIFKICGINPNEEMNWKSFLKALLTINLFWFFGECSCCGHNNTCLSTPMAWGAVVTLVVQYLHQFYGQL